MESTPLFYSYKPEHITIDFLLSEINNKTLNQKMVGAILNAIEGVGQPPAHPRQHAWSNYGYPTDLRSAYLNRPRHSVYFDYDDQDLATLSVLTSKAGILALEKLKEGGGRAVVFMPRPEMLKITMLELENGEPAKSGNNHKKFMLKNITLVIDSADRNHVIFQTDYPTENYPESVTKQLLQGNTVVDVRNAPNLYYLDQTGRQFQTPRLAPGEELVLLPTKKSGNDTPNKQKERDSKKLSNAKSTDFLYISSNLSKTSSDLILLNGMKVLFDQPVPVYPVNLKRKDEVHRGR